MEAVVVEVVRYEPAHQAGLAHSPITEYHYLQQGIPVGTPAVSTFIILDHSVK